MAGWTGSRCVGREVLIGDGAPLLGVVVTDVGRVLRVIVTVMFPALSPWAACLTKDRPSWSMMPGFPKSENDTLVITLGRA